MPRHNGHSQETNKATCRYCHPHQIKGWVKCSHCVGYRNPSRRQMRRANKPAKVDVVKQEFKTKDKAR
jgi:hypothetical protein